MNRPGAGKPGGFTSLQAGRAIAAIAVVAFHAHVFYLPQRLMPGETVSAVFDMGYAGVEFFFVLSGFIMYLVHRRDVGDSAAGRRFLVKRGLRILPFYWWVLGCVALLRVLESGGEGVDPEQFFMSLFLLPMPDGRPLLLDQAWTLSHEFLFYGFFALVLFFPRRGAGAFVAWQAAIVLAMPLGPLVYPLDMVLAPYNLLFSFGMVAAWGFARIRVGLAAAAAWLGSLGFLAVGLADAFSLLSMTVDLRTVLFGASAALAVAGLAALEAAGRLRAARWMVFLGDASYAIYLVHGVVLAVAARAMAAAGLGAVLSPGLALLALVVCGVLGGALAHVLVERPMLRTVKRLQGAKGRKGKGMAEG